MTIRKVKTLALLKLKKAHFNKNAPFKLIF